MKSLTMAMTALLIGLAVPAIASDDERRGHRERDRDGYHESDRDDSGAADTARTGWLSEAEITSKLAESGLKVSRIKADQGRYEVYATEASGAQVKVYLNPTTGAIIRREHEGRS